MYKTLINEARDKAEIHWSFHYSLRLFTFHAIFNHMFITKYNTKNIFLHYKQDVANVVLV